MRIVALPVTPVSLCGGNCDCWSDQSQYGTSRGGSGREEGAGAAQEGGDDQEKTGVRDSEYFTGNTYYYNPSHINIFSSGLHYLPSGGGRPVHGHQDQDQQHKGGEGGGKPIQGEAS